MTEQIEFEDTVFSRKVTALCLQLFLAQFAINLTQFLDLVDKLTEQQKYRRAESRQPSISKKLEQMDFSTTAVSRIHDKLRCKHRAAPSIAFVNLRCVVFILFPSACDMYIICSLVALH